MSIKFEWLGFIRKTKQQLLTDYLSSIWDVALSVPDFDQEEDRVRYIHDEISKLPAEKFDQIQIDLTKVRQLATQKGMLNLIEVAGRMSEVINDLPSEEYNKHDRAIFYRIEYPQTFETAYYINEVLPRKKSLRHGLKVMEVKDIIGSGSELEAGMSEYLVKHEQRGEACKVDTYDFGDSVCFIAYSADYPQDLLFFVNNELKIEVNRPGFQVTFVYHPEGGRLEIDCQGKWQRKHALMEIFNKAVLKSDEPVPEYQEQYDLDKLVIPDFEMTVDPDEAIEQPQLKAIRLANRVDRKERYTIDIEHGEGATSIRTAMQRHGLNLSHYLVDQARISFKFRGIQRTGWVTVNLSLPDSNDLGGEAKHSRVRTYLQQWGIINHEENPS